MENLFATFVKDKSPYWLGVISVVSGGMLFLPTPVIQLLGLETFIEQHRSFVGPVFLVAFTALCISGLVYGYSSLVSRQKRKKKAEAQNATRASYITRLTDEEIEYLMPYVEGKNSQTFPLTDGVRGGLEAKGIIYRSSNMGSMYGFSYNIQPWALDAVKMRLEKEKTDGR